MPDVAKLQPKAKKRVFLDLDSLTQWDHHVAQRFPQAEKVPISGLEPGSTGPWDAAQATSFGSVIKEDGLFRMWYYGLRGAAQLQGTDRPADRLLRGKRRWHPLAQARSQNHRSAPLSREQSAGHPGRALWRGAYVAGSRFEVSVLYDHVRYSTRRRHSGRCPVFRTR